MTEHFATSPAERIATVLHSHRRQTATESTGAWGGAVSLDNGAVRVTLAEGTTVIVSGHAAGWAVSFKGMQGIDADLETAAALALEAGGPVSVTRDYRL